MEVKDDSGVSVHTSKQDEAESSVIASSNPVVFQCSQCDAIVGDSTSWVSANKIMRTITLGRVTSKVGVKPEIQISQSSVDKGSTYSVVYCISCNEVLGKQYLASPPELDYIRGSFTIHVEKLNSYEVGSAQTSGTSDLADMLSVPSPGYLMARVNKMQFLIVTMNERIRKLEACHCDEESTGKTVNMEDGEKNPRTCTVGETESVSSSDNFSTKPHTFSSYSEAADVFDTGYGCPERLDVLVAKPLNEDNIADYRRDFEQHSNDVNIINENSERVLKRNVRSNFCGSRHVNARPLQNEKVHSVLDEGEPEGSIDTDNEENENFRQSQTRSGRKGRREVMEMNQQRFRNERSSESTGVAMQAGNFESPKTGSKNSNLKVRGTNNESLKSGFMSPNSRGLVSRNQSNMETWPSPGIERKGRESKKNWPSPGIERMGRESKKRKILDDNLC